VVFLPDGKLLASTSRDQTVGLWSPATGASLQVLETNDMAQELSFSSKGRYLDTDQGQLPIGPLGGSIYFSPIKQKGNGEWIFENGAWVV
jgi:hypothetical protein